jgi:hypothetical protein
MKSIIAIFEEWVPKMVLLPKHLGNAQPNHSGPELDETEVDRIRAFWTAEESAKAIPKSMDRPTKSDTKGNRDAQSGKRGGIHDDL